MEKIEDLMSETICNFKETTSVYADRLTEIRDEIELVKQQGKVEKDNAERTHQDHDGSCKCKVFLDLMTEKEKQDKLDKLHHELLETNTDVISTLASDTKEYKVKYGELKEERRRALEWQMATGSNTLRCPKVTFDKQTKHKDVVFEDECLTNTLPSGTKISSEHHHRQLKNVVGAVGNRCFRRTDIGYFAVHAHVQIVRKKKIQKARLCDIFDVYIGQQEVIDKLRDPGVLYQYNMFGINVWYNNMKQRVVVDILSSSKHVDRYVLPKKIKHGGSFEIELGFLLDMQRSTIHVLDNRKRMLIGSATKLNTKQPMWPAVQIHHCYYTPQYFDTSVSFVSMYDPVTSDDEWRKYLLSLVKENEIELW